ncbi:MAG: hypothetical protein A3I89_03185 [Candidatus Harrisonbacteria bacterium RIFCSPLOWO2_02_FULL_41_11]|uniref:Uncharacterized protein n=1 Tax=Candidatus Harrisonbacteria bacterium RIFCSPHIGHO2_02_FULL_42_16 TaxID=1798404 RepID=A0A1G1ZKJ8_9BACT|nr:MAG: hypothetical protein A3B92_02675 [Candidatus Harrisonbacteria bacterium RIFCSPHIGHO2_02_FULL_42_16]OGY66242.1 MAG: hypothetical protein A3I89_03185 [Candidatus Harrisonbacteria bacterium RIFCSPLOWO2_02_FULL_41_11]
MDFLLRLFDLFIGSAKKLSAFIPQNGDDVIRLFQQLLMLAGKVNIWFLENIGVNFQSMLSAIGKIAILWASFLMEFLRNIANRI